MKHYTEVTTREEMEALLDRMRGFHDSMTKELHLTNRGWVDSDQSMVMSHRFDVRLLVQSQWEPAAIELLFVGVEELNAGEPGEYWDASGTVEIETASVEKRRVSISFDKALRITAERLFFVDRPDWAGPAERFGTGVPHPDAVTATRLDDEWRQCSKCAEAFQVPEQTVYSSCPGCRSWTELKSTDDQP